jgi:anti-sigma factor RsiW
MSDALSRLTEQELADLCALADGTLAPERRPAVEARVAASPELLELVARQRRAVEATRTLEADTPPASLQASLRKRQQAGAVRPRRRWRLATVGALAAVATVIASVVITGGPGGPTVAEAAALAARPATEPAPQRQAGSANELAVDVEGISFPDLARSAGWRAVGVRRDRVDGRNATVVHYAKEGRTLAYVIVSGSGLPQPSDGETTTLGDVEFRTLTVDGRPVVTWRRDGHTCVLIGQAPRDELVRLAGYGTPR